jgi:methyl-accepting chemotaxis protein
MLLNYTTGDILLSTNSSLMPIKTTGNVGQNQYFSGAKSVEGENSIEDKIFFSNPFFSTNSNNFIIPFSGVIRPISLNNATPSEILVVEIDPNSIWDVISPRDSNNKPIDTYYQNIGLGDTGEIYLVNYFGLAISRSRFNVIDSNFILKDDFSRFNGFKTAKNEGYKLGEEKNYLEQDVYGVYVYLGLQPLTNDLRDSFLLKRLNFDLPWILVVEINQNEVLIPINRIQEQLNTSLLLVFILMIVIGIIVTILSIFIANTFSKPIIKLSRQSKGIAKGDLTIDIEKSTKKNEIGELQNSFVIMMNFLRTAIQSIYGVVNTLSRSARDMAASSEEVNASSEEMSSVSQNISKGAQKQLEFLNNSLKQMEEIEKEFAEKIGGIKLASEIINSISRKVNMLALNASIEAARVGEYGIGFAVVAENIRGLAEEAKESVDKVNNIVTDMTTSLSKGMSLLIKSLKNVNKVAEETALGSEEASAATEEQSTIMQELSVSAQELEKISMDLEEIVKKFTL